MNSKKMIIAIAFILLLTCLTLTGCASMPVSATPVTNSYSFHDSITDIDIDCSSSDVVLLPSETGVCEVICRETEQSPVSVQLSGNTLKIQHSRKKGIGWISFQNITLEITVYLPQGDYRSLKVETSSGSIDVAENFRFQSAVLTSTSGSIRCRADVDDRLAAAATSGHVSLLDLSAGNLALTTSSGGIAIQNVSAENAALACTSGGIFASGVHLQDSLAIGTSSGDVRMTDVVAEKTIDIGCTSGDVTLEACDAGEIRIETTSGDVLCSFLSGKSFRTETSSGSVTVPEDSAPYPCEIRTTSGNIMVMTE